MIDEYLGLKFFSRAAEFYRCSALDLIGREDLLEAYERIEYAESEKAHYDGF